MASQAQISSVKIQLPDEAIDLGVTDDIVAAQYDLVGQTKTILFCLRAIAAKVASVEDVSESGSQRTQQFHTRLMAQITDWQARSDREDALAGTLPVKLNARLHTAVRV